MASLRRGLGHAVREPGAYLQQCCCGRPHILTGLSCMVQAEWELPKWRVPGQPQERLTPMGCGTLLSAEGRRLQCEGTPFCLESLQRESTLKDVGEIQMPAGGLILGILASVFTESPIKLQGSLQVLSLGDTWATNSSDSASWHSVTQNYLEMALG